ncbi:MULTISPECIES: sensor histidine kinase [Pseudofrankia]|uniref:sensor histidine kinase n=1 Tax=Pseudofrankia TaxID=2994363 RepID=UPI000486969A|nr:MULTISPECIES: ATP-binding protein [Pseudofrankia]
MAAVLGLLAGWPFWSDHPALAVVNALNMAALVLSARCLSARSRVLGFLLLATGVCWSLSWLMSWDAGPAPLAGFLIQPLCWFFQAWLVLTYPDGRILGRLDTAVVTASGPALVGGHILIVVTSRPEWNGFDPDTYWPRPALISLRLFHPLLVAVAGGCVLLCIVITMLALRRRLDHVHGLDRVVFVPVLLATGLAGFGTALVVTDPIRPSQLDGLPHGFALQGGALAVGPAALLVATAYLRLALPSRAQRLLRQTHPPTATTTRTTLRAVLRDPSLDVYLWLTDENRYVDVDGEPAPDKVVLGSRTPATGLGAASSHRHKPRSIATIGARTPSGGRWRVAVPVSGPEPVALIDCDQRLRGHEVAVLSILTTSTPWLRNIALQSGLQARLAQTAQANQRVADAEADERRRLERDLATGLASRLADLDALAVRLAESSSAPAAGRLVADIRDGIRAVGDEARDVARGLHPVELSEVGLRAAVLAVGTRLGLRPRMDADEPTLAPATERLMYFALLEGLTNAAKHAATDAVRVRVHVTTGRLVGEVADDGRGGAHIPPGGGLAGLQERVTAAGGSLSLRSAAGSGTSLIISLPLNSVGAAMI